MKSKTRRKLSVFVFMFLFVGAILAYAETLSPTLLDFPSGTLNIDTINLGGVSRDTWPAGGADVKHDQDLNTTDDVTFASVDTGQGANELYDMDQNVLTTSSPTFGTIDTGQGANELYDMDQNVLTTSAPTFRGATVDWLKLGEDNETEFPAGTPGPAGTVEGLPFSYVIFKNDTATYMVNGTTGEIDWYHSDSAMIMNAVRGNCTEKGGRVFQKRGEYSLSTALTFDGRLKAGSNYQDFNIIWEGEGMYNTILKPAENVNAIILRNQTSIFLKNIGVEVPTSNAADAIYGSNAGIKDRCVQYAQFENIHIRGGSGSANWWGINLRNPWKLNVKGTNHLVTQGAGGILINNTKTTQYGDSKWEGYMYIYINRDNAKGIYLLGFDSHTTLMTSDMHVYIHAPDASHSGITGVHMENARNIMLSHIQMEYMDTCFFFDDCQRIQIKDCPFLNTQGDGTIFDIESNCQHINLFEMNHIIVRSGATVKVIDDDVNTLFARTVCRSWTVINSGTMSFDRTTYTKMMDVKTSNGGASEAAGDGTILVGDKSVNITYALIDVPGHMTITGTHSQVSTYWVENITSTGLTIRVPNPITDSGKLVSYELTINTR